MSQITMQSVRKKYPQYDDLPDKQLADALYTKYYSDMEPEAFYERVGLSNAAQSDSDLMDLLEPTQQPQGDVGGFRSGAAGVRDELLDKASEKTGLGPIPDALSRFALGTAASIADVGARPVDATKEIVTHAVSAPSRFAAGYNDSIWDLRQGDLRGAGENAANAITAGMETVLMASPSSAVTSKAATRLKPTPNPAQAAAERAGIDLPPVALTDSAAAKGAAQQIKENFIAGKGVRENTQRAVDQTKAGLERVASSYGQASPREAGEIIIDGARLYDKKANELYSAAFRDIDGLAKATPRATADRVQREVERFDDPKFREQFEPGVVEEMRELFSGDVSVNDLRQARTRVREAQSKFKVDQNQNDKFLGSLEGALTDDIHEAVRSTAGEGALARMRAADRYHAKIKETMSTAFKPFTSRNATDEGAFRNIVQSMQSQTTRTGRGDLRRIRDLRKALSTEQLDEVAGGILNAAGRSKETDAFSVQTLRTNWRNMGEAQKSIMFGGPQTARRSALDDLMTAVDRLAEVEDLANHSRSGVNVQNIVTAGGMFAEPVTTSAFIGGQAAAGRLLSNPKYTRVVTSLLNAEARAARMTAAGQGQQALAILQSTRTKAIAAITAIEGIDGQLKQELVESLSANDNLPTDSTIVVP